METVRVADAHAGMELLYPVKTLRGLTLFNAGTTLTEKHIKALKAWGVPKIDIRGSKRASPKKSVWKMLDDRIREDVTREVDFIFQKNDLSSPIIRELYDLAIDYKIKQKKRIR